MAFEQVSVNAAGQGYAGWKQVSFTASIVEASRSAEIHVTEIGPWPSAPPWHFPPFTPVTLTAGGDLLLSGWVGKYQPEANARSHEVSLTLVSDGYNYVDCSIQHATGNFENKSIFDIADEMAKPLGVKITVSPDAEATAKSIVDWFQIRLGSTPWVEMMRLLPARGLTMSGQADGSVQICKGGSSSQRHAGGLIQGENIEQMSALHSGLELSSQTEAVSQSDGIDPQTDLQPSGMATDSSVPFFRPKQIFDAEHSTPEPLKTLAEHHSSRAAAYAKQANIMTPGWRDQGGELWKPGYMVAVQAPYLHLEQDMMIESLVFSQSDSGTFASLTLVPPETGGGKSPDVVGAASSPWYRYKQRPRGAKPPPTFDRWRDQ